ncbi:MAG: Mur ligase family protein [Candidatus Gottesmanbacteria bacterium]
MKKLLSIWTGKLLYIFSNIFKIGSGSTWPGHISLMIEKNIIPILIDQLRQGVIIVGGTNGKTTTTKMISEIMKYKNIRVIKNDSGANLINGIASTLVNSCNWIGKINADWAIFETDEATLSILTTIFTPKIIIILNLFRDQLDRYGEIDIITKKWQKALDDLPRSTTVILNADDPNVALLGNDLDAKTLYFGLNEPHLYLDKVQHAADAIYCPRCGKKLIFEGFFFSHLGHWYCLNCGAKRPDPSLSQCKSPLRGIYNKYNSLAATLTAKTLNIKDKEINKALQNFEPAFGRQENFEVDDENVKIILSKNPAGFNESIRVLEEFPGKKKTVLIVLNDRIPDGRDVSWIWDVDFENITNYADNLICSGDRTFDLGLRIKYADFNINKLLIDANLNKAIKTGLKKISEGETLYVLATYSGMLEVRKILIGHKLL